MKKLVLLFTLLMTLISLSLGQEKQNISQEQAWSIAKQALIEREIVEPNWLGGAVCVEPFREDGEWKIVFSTKEKGGERDSKGTISSISVFVSKNGEVRSIFPNH